MSAPRVLGYDDLHDWLGAEIDDAESMAREYTEQGDDEDAAEFRGRAAGLRAVLAHIEFELVPGR